LVHPGLGLADRSPNVLLAQNYGLLRFGDDVLDLLQVVDRKLGPSIGELLPSGKGLRPLLQVLLHEGQAPAGPAGGYVA
jgi:hypothetical protein